MPRAKVVADPAWRGACVVYRDVSAGMVEVPWAAGASLRWYYPTAPNTDN